MTAATATKIISDAYTSSSQHIESRNIPYPEMVAKAISIGIIATAISIMQHIEPSGRDTFYRSLDEMRTAFVERFERR